MNQAALNLINQILAAIPLALQMIVSLEGVMAGKFSVTADQRRQLIAAGILDACVKRGLITEQMAAPGGDLSNSVITMIAGVLNVHDAIAAHLPPASAAVAK